ncbi:MAG: hypothetical protein QM270_07040 [Bacillota bacterium]|nr:hypothetical protein [Bacillota bacterium]
MSDDQNKQPEVDETSGTQPEVDETKGKETKTYTQEEVDRLVAIQKAKLPDKKAWDEFQAWQQEKKKSETPNPEADEALRKLAEAEARIQMFENREKAIKAGVAAEFADYATYEVQKLVNDDTDFDTALITWLKTNERFKTGQQSPPSSEGMRHGSAPPKTDGVEDAFFRRNPTLKGKV